MKPLLALLTISLWSTFAWSNSSVAVFSNDLASISSTKNPEIDAQKIANFQLRCEYLRTLIVGERYPVDCFTNYHHFGASNFSQKNLNSYRVASFNLLHPGTSKALYKDYNLIARMMNRFDIVAGLELLSTVGRDEQNNRNVINFLHDAPGLIEKLQAQRAGTQDPRRLAELEERITKLENDRVRAYGLLRAPGYLLILEELKKMDSSWSLILSPRGDSALPGSVEELVGFYYRASTITPDLNPHCQEYRPNRGAGRPVACIASLTSDFMGENLYVHFARRPFMATFKARNTKFTVLAKHTVFTYSGDENAQKDLMQKSFGVDSHRDLGPGINSANFARFAEVRNTLRFMNRYRAKYNDNKIMLMADTNLNSSNQFWPNILDAFPGGSLLINEATTLSPQRYNAAGKETNGVANDYDHFILDKKAFSQCDDGKVVNFYNDSIYKALEKKYIIRSEVVGINKSFTDSTFTYDYMTPFNANDDLGNEEGDLPPIDDPTTVKLEYPLTPAGQSKMDRFVAKFERNLKNVFTVKKNEVVLDDYQVHERAEALRRRVFLRQLTNPFYHRHMQEILSDHFPIVLTCNFK